MQWSDQVQAAFSLTYQGELTQKQIAAKLGISDRTIRNWARDPAWKSRYQAMLTAWDREWRLDYRLRTLEEQECEEADYEARHTAWRERLEAKYPTVYHRS
jgi:transcriptional regulator with XRE-family HTH domain